MLRPSAGFRDAGRPRTLIVRIMRDEHAGHRHTRLQQILREELESLLRDELTDPRLEGLRCTGVELSVDYRSARVRFFVPDENATPANLAKVMRGLERATPFLHARMGEALEMKRLPALHFVYDRDAAGEMRAAQVMREEKKK
jgi:ribosome-binding factor A